MLAILLTAGSIVVLVAMGWLTHQHLGKQAESWAERLQNERDP